VSSEIIFFFVLAFVAVASGFLMVTRTNPVNSALFLILNFFALAGLYLTLHAQFVAVIQILVYAGAIMVLVLFVIMLLNLQDEAPMKEHVRAPQIVGIVLAVCSLALILQAILWTGNPSIDSMLSQSPYASEIGTVQYIGTELFTTYVFPVELVSVLLLAAMIGAVVLAKKRFP